MMTSLEQVQLQRLEHLTHPQTSTPNDPGSHAAMATHGLKARLTQDIAHSSTRRAGAGDQENHLATSDIPLSYPKKLAGGFQQKIAPQCAGIDRLTEMLGHRIDVGGGDQRHPAVGIARLGVIAD